MREIKFRAWNLKDYAEKEDDFYAPKNTMVSWDIIQSDRNHWLDNSLFGTKFIIMQYTGLKDKNGKEIYEGDIWKMEIPKEDGGDAYGTIIFHEGCFMRVEGQGQYGSEQLQWDSDFGTGVVSDMKIIGNIYENPELLK